MTARSIPGLAVAFTLVALSMGAACKRRPTAAVAAETACLSNAACGDGRRCVFSPGLCGRGPVPGRCAPRPASCEATRALACGCDGKVYENECLAHEAGVDLAVMGGCDTAIADWAACGPRFCDVRTSYCEIYLSDVFEIPTTYTCRPLPAACRPRDGGAAPTCDCFPPATPCHAFCGPLPTAGVTGFHLTCQGVKEPRR